MLGGAALCRQGACVRAPCDSKRRPPSVIHSAWTDTPAWRGAHRQGPRAALAALAPCDRAAPRALRDSRGARGGLRAAGPAPSPPLPSPPHWILSPPCSELTATPQHPSRASRPHRGHGALRSLHLGAGSSCPRSRALMAGPVSGRGSMSGRCCQDGWLSSSRRLTRHASPVCPALSTEPRACDGSADR